MFFFIFALEKGRGLMLAFSWLPGTTFLILLIICQMSFNAALITLVKNYEK
tara:strand:- start:1281 stop:1433 length:153 start_codon:yes stop_codon:yes gene_type:complete